MGWEKNECGKKEISQMSERRETIRWKNGQSNIDDLPVEWKERMGSEMDELK